MKSVIQKMVLMLLVGACAPAAQGMQGLFSPKPAPKASWTWWQWGLIGATTAGAAYAVPYLMPWVRPSLVSVRARFEQLFMGGSREPLVIKGKPVIAENRPIVPREEIIVVREEHKPEVVKLQVIPILQGNTHPSFPSTTLGTSGLVYAKLIPGIGIEVSELKKPVGFSNEEQSCCLDGNQNKWKKNSCYIIASVLASLLHTPRVVELLLEKGEKSPSKLIQALYLLAKQMYLSEQAPEKLAWPELYKILVCELKLEWGEIGDAEAVLSSLLRYLAKEWPDVSLAYEQKLTCGTCTIESSETKPDVFLVPFGKDKKVALKIPELETLTCTTCGTKGLFKRTLTKLPMVLCIGVNRVAYENGQGSKIMDPVQINQELVLEKTTYVLRAIIVHRGKNFDLGGHYFSYVRLENKWWQVNDHEVSDQVYYGFDFKTEKGLFQPASDIVSVMTRGQNMPAGDLENDTPVIAIYEQKRA